jgi:hypothetical protein
MSNFYKFENQPALESSKRRAIISASASPLLRERRSRRYDAFVTDFVAMRRDNRHSDVLSGHFKQSMSDLLHCLCGLPHGRNESQPVWFKLKLKLAKGSNRDFMTNTISRTPLVIRFINTKPRMLMEITNTTAKTLKSVEILTVFLTNNEGPAGFSRAHIRFDPIKSVQPNEKAVVSHRTWINGMPASDAQDQMARLEVVLGSIKPYVLDISWEDVNGKAQFQRIPVGH